MIFALEFAFDNYQFFNKTAANVCTLSTSEVCNTVKLNCAFFSLTTQKGHASICIIFNF